MMTREEAKEIFLNRGFIKVDGGTIFDGNKWREACSVISKWLEQESCEDAINRARVLSMAITKQYNTKQAISMTKDEVIRDWNDMIDFVETLPSVHPVEKTGEWIKHEDPRYAYDRENGDIDAGISYRCSLCSKVGNKHMNYCPNCGAKMKGEKE